MSSKASRKTDRNEDDEVDEDEPTTLPRPKKKSKFRNEFIEDAAEESGDENDDDDEDDEELDGKDEYEIGDGFVVDENTVEKKTSGILEDSDDEEDDDDDDDDTGKRRKKKRVRKLGDQLDEEDLDLIAEAQGLQRDVVPEEDELEEAAKKAKKVVARTAAELQEGLFADGDDDEPPTQQQQQSIRRQPEQYDEDGLDDFIEDDIGDQDAIRRAGAKHRDESQVNEAHLHEASEIFGTEYLDFLNANDEDGETGFAEDDDEDEDDISDDDDEDLFDGDEDAKSEALKLKREKRKLDKAERRKKAQAAQAEARKLKLRRAFEPVQLVENFCTEKDDLIRSTDVPERLYDRDFHFYGTKKVDTLDEVEREQAQWIAKKIRIDAREGNLQAIANILYFYETNLEPTFISRYRKDYINSELQSRIYEVIEASVEYHRMVVAREKAEKALNHDIDDDLRQDEASTQKLQKLKEQLEDAQTKLEETQRKKDDLQTQLAAFGKDDDDDEMFADDDDDEEAKQRTQQHLSTTQSLLEARSDKVDALKEAVESATAQAHALQDPAPLQRMRKKMAAELWNKAEYQLYLASAVDVRHVQDIQNYLNLIREGDVAIRQKELPNLHLSDNSSKKKSRRNDRDLYRTSVSEGLRSIAYQFLLAPQRAGVKLEQVASKGQFDYSYKLAGTEGQMTSPLEWVPSTPTANPEDFSQNLIGSGELVLLDQQSGKTSSQANLASDPLRGCRYVAAMELANEPRIRRHLRDIYRKHALLSTIPTKRGILEIDSFHDHYGLHLIRGKPVAHHFPPSDLTPGLSTQEQMEQEAEMKKREKASCLQFLNILKAQHLGTLTAYVHLPLKELNDKWFSPTDGKVTFGKGNQSIDLLMNDLIKVYMPTDNDSSDWSSERMKVLEAAVTTYLLPAFEKELMKDIRDAAVKIGVLDAGNNLKEMALEGPYRPAEMLHDENRFLVPTGDLSFIGVCCSTDGKDASYMAMVDERGVAQDYLAIPSGIAVNQPKMREKVITFLLQTRPAAVVVGTSGGFASRGMQQKLNEIVKEALQRWDARDIQGVEEDDEAFLERQRQMRSFQSNDYYDDEDTKWTCNTDLIDDSVSQLYGRSVRSRKEFPDYTTTLKCAISIARYAKDPLAEITYAWSVASDSGTFGTEMLYLNIHPLQQVLPKPLLLTEYEHVLCEIVAALGTDLNMSCTSDHLRGLLMFVPGLGPRKADNLKQTVQKLGTVIARRRDLLEKRLMGPLVYNNAVAFVRIRDIDQNLDQDLHPLDSTRLHPDVYVRHNWAIKIAFDSLEREDPKSNAASMKALRDAMDNSYREVERLFNATKAEWVVKHGTPFYAQGWDPKVNVPSQMWRDNIEELDLEKFADMIEQKNEGKWHSHLEMIKWEFRLPYADIRMPMKHLAGDNLYHLITGETDQSLRPGKEVTGVVTQNLEFGSKVMVEGKIPGFIPLRSLSDQEVADPNDVVTPNQTITAIVIEVKKEHMSVNLSLRIEDFRKTPSSWQRPLTMSEPDLCFDHGASKRIEDENTARREQHIEALQLSLLSKGEASQQRKGRVTKRACLHPAFTNDKSEVERRIKEGGAGMVGEAIIRPSTKNPDVLAVHWVFRNGHEKVFEVNESEKETDASIGSKLTVKVGSDKEMK